MITNTNNNIPITEKSSLSISIPIEKEEIDILKDLHNIYSLLIQKHESNIENPYLKNNMINKIKTKKNTEIISIEKKILKNTEKIYKFRIEQEKIQEYEKEIIELNAKISEIENVDNNRINEIENLYDVTEQENRIKELNTKKETKKKEKNNNI